jgi:hypothetical protein
MPTKAITDKKINQLINLVNIKLDLLLEKNINNISSISQEIKDYIQDIHEYKQLGINYGQKYQMYILFYIAGQMEMLNRNLKEL